MFEKKNIIFSESIGVCTVEDIVKLAAEKNQAQVTYYLLKSVADKKKISYIPVEKHEYVLRELITKEEALEKKNSKDYEEMNEYLKEEVEYVIGKSDTKE